MSHLISQPTETIDALLCFDANLPKLEKCKPNCSYRNGISCIHRFNHRVEVERYNTKKFWKWADLNIFLYFLRDIFGGIAENRIVLNKCVFMILTKDRNFIHDVMIQWEESGMKEHLNLIFYSDSISLDGLTVFIQQVSCPNYGNSRTDDLKCVFSKVNDFLTKKLKA